MGLPMSVSNESTFDFVQANYHLHHTSTVQLSSVQNDKGLDIRGSDK